LVDPCDDDYWVREGMKRFTSGEAVEVWGWEFKTMQWRKFLGEVLEDDGGRVVKITFPGHSVHDGGWPRCHVNTSFEEFQKLKEGQYLYGEKR
jgi:hypothetical protein